MDELQICAIGSGRFGVFLVLRGEINRVCDVGGKEGRRRDWIGVLIV